jgi:retinol dehydrogenase 14
MQSKRILVTGANSGLGLASSLQLARQGHHVVMLCRDQSRGMQALAEVLQAGSAELVLCDLADMDDIRRFGRKCREKEELFDVVLHNAGVYMARRQFTPQGHEATIGINHLGPYLLTSELMDCLRRPARVVLVASDAHRGGKMELADLMAEERFSGFRQYAVSKLANILFASELSRRLEGAGVTVNSLHPGGVNTGLGDGNKVWYRPLGRLVKKLMASPMKGAGTQVWLASSDEVEGHTGGYYAKRSLKKPNAQGQDMELAGQLWRLSADLCGLSPSWVGQ